MTVTDPKELLLTALRAGDAKRSRSTQVQIGPSEVGGMLSVHVLHKYRLVHQRLVAVAVRCGTDLTINLKLMTTN